MVTDAISSATNWTGTTPGDTITAQSKNKTSAFSYLNLLITVKHSFCNSNIKLLQQLINKWSSIMKWAPIIADNELEANISAEATIENPALCWTLALAAAIEAVIIHFMSTAAP